MKKKFERVIHKDRGETISDHVKPLDAVNRLFTLAHFLRTKVPAKRFDIDHFSVADIKGKFSLKEDCGTAGCIAGWSTCVVKALRIDGRSLVSDILAERYNSENVFGSEFGLTYDETEEICSSKFEKDTPEKAADFIEQVGLELAEFHDLDVK